MSNLKLITTEKFGDLQCNFYRNMNDILLTREQIGTALEYVNPQKAIDNIHAKHRYRLDELSIPLKTRGMTGQKYNTTFYNQRGIMEICRWSRQTKANEFMDWVWDIVEKYRSNQLQFLDLSPLTETISALSQSLATLSQNMVNMQQEIQGLKQSQHNRYIQNKKISFCMVQTYESQI